MAITKFDRATCRLLSQEIEAALKAVAQKHGVAIKAGSGSFADTTFKLKVEVSVISASGVAQSSVVTDFEQHAKFLGLQESDLGKSFLFRGTSYTICGLKLSGRKYPILAKNKNGKVYKFQVSDVRRLFTNPGDAARDSGFEEAEASGEFA